jgi:mono/diheme cytochrome c family protein
MSHHRRNFGARALVLTLVGASALSHPESPRAEPKYAGEKKAAIILPPAAKGPVDFARDIAPIFAERCLSCHGPNKQRAGFRLDSPQALLKPGDDGPRLVPGKSTESPLVLLLARTDEDRMPPPDKGDALDTTTIAKIRAWVDAGAQWPANFSFDVKEPVKTHWAFVAPIRPGVPVVKNSAWVKNPIDAFVLAKLEKNGTTPSATAENLALLRRAHLDVTGLPPTLAAVDASDTQKGRDAYKKMIETLLGSPAYGERWGQLWLDAARYADTDGYEKDVRRFSWFYRDWVIDAVNRDMPYDQFVIEQLAGDLLPGANQSQHVATGFLRNSMVNEEGGSDPEQFRIEALFDRMDAVGKSILGITTQCAQCHTHKYDPLTHEDYYRMFAFFNQNDEASIPAYTPEAEKTRLGIRDQIRAIDRALQAKTPDWQARVRRWETQQQYDVKWTPIQAPFIDDTTGGQRYLMMPDGSYRAAGYAPTKHNAQYVVDSDADTITAFALEQFTDPNLPLGGPGRSLRGTSALTEFRAEVAPRGKPLEKTAVRFIRAEADWEQPEKPLEKDYEDKSGRNRITGPASFAIDDKEETAWGIDAGPGRRNRFRRAIFVPEKPIHHAGGITVTITLSQRHGGWNSDDLMNHDLGRFRVSISSDPAVRLDRLTPDVRALLKIPAAKRNSDMWNQLFSIYRENNTEWKKENQNIQVLWQKHPEPTPALVVSDRPGGRVTHILKRGDFLKLGAEVKPGVPAFLPPLPETNTPPNRLTFARWMVDRKSPTPARVIVNRIWQTYFGTGLVATNEDFGTQGEAPSHPELLDWLAVELMENGWSLKHLHRLILNSATYQQQSRVTPEMLARDPYNRDLSRGARIRVDGEIVRDIQLATSGLLDLQRGGPPIMPAAPEHLFLPPSSYGPFPWITSTGATQYRRSVYIFRRRSTPFPLLATFDTPKGDQACVRRIRSNTPLQALMTLNETSSLEAARALGRRMLEQKGDPGVRIEHGFRRVLSRRPEPAELESLVGLYGRQQKRLAAGWSDPWLIASGTQKSPSALPADATPTDLAAYTIVARTLLNLDETITKE